MSRKEKSPTTQSPTSEPLFTLTEEDVTPKPETPAEKPKKKSKVTEIATPEPPPPQCGPDEANAVLDLLQPVCATAAAKFYKVDKAIASRAFQFSEMQRSKINPPLIRVLNKWTPYILRKWGDEVALGLVLFSSINAQLGTMRMLDAQERARKTPPPPPTPISTPPVSEETAKAGD